MFLAIDGIERLIPVFPDRFDTQILQREGYFFGGTFVTYVELLQRLWIRIITSRFCFTFSTHRCYAKACHIVAEAGAFAGRIGDIHIVIEDTGCKCHLGQFAVAHDNIRLESSVFRRTHTREIKAVLGFPVMLLQITQMIGHHSHVRAPFFLQADQHTHADAVYAGLSHTVESIDTPFEFRLHSARMIDIIVCLVIGFLETDHTVHTMMRQFAILFCRKRHHFNLQVGEIRLGQIKSTGNIRNACLCRILACYQKQILKRSQFLDGLVFVDDFFFRQDRSLHRIADMETTIDTRIGTRVGDI